jgi:dienelactone hydrolase
LAVALTAILIVAVLVGIASLLGGGPSAKKGTSTTTTTRGPLTPPSGIGSQTVTWTDAGLVFNPVPGGGAGPRTLVTEIWYPSIGGSETAPTAGEKPDYGGGPFPVIVFAHGFDTLPATYNPLLASWVKAGFVVVAPEFPDENASRINSLGHLTATQIEEVEADVVNEPYDIAYVVGKVESGADGAASSGASWLKGLAEPGKIALAGHSDGAQAVAALVYGEKYASHYEAMATRPFGVVILSGSELSGSYAPPASPPPMLFVQSAADRCNLPQDAGTLFRDAGGGLFLKLIGAHHFSPYMGKGPAAPVVERVTTAFLKAAAQGTPEASALAASADVAGIATLYGPSRTPVMTALPAPSQLQRSQACAVPSL